MRIKTAVAAAVMLVLAMHSSSMAPLQAATPAPQSAEEQITSLMRGEAYEGPSLPAPRGLDGKPDFTGLWRPVREAGKPGGNLGKDFPGFILPYTAAGLRAEAYAKNHTVDPEALCIPGGIPRHNGSGLPFEVLHTPGRIAFTYHYNTSRRISIGSKLKLDQNAPRRYFGTAVARWEGDTLVIETTRLFDSSHNRIWLDENGDPTSDQTHVVERWTRPDFHHVRLEMTVTDPKYYREPIRFVRTWTAAPADAGQQEYACNESNLAVENIGPGAGVIGPDGNRGYGEAAPIPDEPPGPEAYGL